MRLNEINIRDPFILPYEGKYYMYVTRVQKPYPGADWGEQTGFDVYISNDLEDWSEPQSVFEVPESFWATKEAWAPEVHFFNERFYMLATFCADNGKRATQALVADSPRGPFQVFGEPLTPSDWVCLDGTLYVEDGVPYLVFSHEWLQVDDGEIAMIQLKQDLSAAVGEPKILFNASESGWADAIHKEDKIVYVTDGPWIVKEDNQLFMFWSSFYKEFYAEGIAISESGKIAGPWKHSKQLLFDKDGGHGMLFQDFSGRKYFALHRPNNALFERPHFFEVEKTIEGYQLKK